MTYFLKKTRAVNFIRLNVHTIWINYNFKNYLLNTVVHHYENDLELEYSDKFEYFRRTTSA